MIENVGEDILIGISHTLNASTGLTDERYLQLSQLEGGTDLSQPGRETRRPRETEDVQRDFYDVNTFYFDSLKYTLYITIQHRTGTLVVINVR